MLPIDKILCPVDLSSPSREALSGALELAHMLDAKLYVLHVVVPFPVPIGGFGEIESDVARIESERQHLAQRAVTELVNGISADFPVATRTMVLVGETVDKILEVVSREEIGMIVMSTHGQTGLRHWLIGSITDKIIRTSSCPVLTIHPNASPKASQQNT